jgi:hypothetical protein
MDRGATAKKDRWRPRLRLLATIALTVAVVAPAHATPALRSAAKASAPSGFTAVAVVTTDRDWLKKWNTPTPGVSLNGTDTLHPGQHATLIVLFSNASARNGRALIKCDVAITHTPKQGSPDQSMRPTTCYDGLAPDPNRLVLTELQIEIQADSKGPTEVTHFDIGVTDANGGGRVPLSLAIRDQ